MRQVRLKAILSILLLTVFLLICASGTMLYFGKTGLILGISRAFLLRSHALLALLMLILACCHLFLNWRVLKMELRKLFMPGADGAPASKKDDRADKR